MTLRQTTAAAYETFKTFHTEYLMDPSALREERNEGIKLLTAFESALRSDGRVDVALETKGVFVEKYLAPALAKHQSEVVAHNIGHVVPHISRRALDVRILPITDLMTATQVDSAIRYLKLADRDREARMLKVLERQKSIEIQRHGPIR